MIVCQVQFEPDRRPTLMCTDAAIKDRDQSVMPIALM
jgi:hypothetical protein